MASGREQGASEPLVPKKQKEIRDTDDTAMTSLFDDTIPTSTTTQSDQSEVTITVCTEDMKELYVTPSCARYKCLTARINVCSTHSSDNECISPDAIVTLSDDHSRDTEQQEARNLDKREDDEVPTLEAKSDETDHNTVNTTEGPEHRQPETISLGATKQQPEPSSNDTTGVYQNGTTPSCRPNQKERILTPSTSTPQHHTVAKQPVPSILPFAHYSAMDDHSINLLFATEDNDQGGIGYELMGSHGLECQICCDGSVQCVFKPCGHAQTCRSCSNHFLHRPCPFCGRLVLAYEIL